MSLLAKLEEALGYEFQDKNLLLRGVTHPSYLGDHQKEKNNQRLEYLGDAVIELVISRYLYGLDDKTPEGVLTRLRSNIVSEKPLSAAAKAIGLGNYLRMSAGEKKSGGETKPSILSDTFEAVIAAVFLDGGFEAAQCVALRLLNEQIATALEKPIMPTDYKSLLQEKLQSGNAIAILYQCDEVTGPAHERNFSSSIWVSGKRLGGGSGTTKKQSEQMAAREALIAMGELSHED